MFFLVIPNPCSFFQNLKIVTKQVLMKQAHFTCCKQAKCLNQKWRWSTFKHVHIFCMEPNDATTYSSLMKRRNVSSKSNLTFYHRFHYLPSYFTRSRSNVEITILFILFIQDKMSMYASKFLISSIQNLTHLGIFIRQSNALRSGDLAYFFTLNHTYHNPIPFRRSFHYHHVCCTTKR